MCAYVVFTQSLETVIVKAVVVRKLGEVPSQSSMGLVTALTQSASYLCSFLLDSRIWDTASGQCLKTLIGECFGLPGRGCGGGRMWVGAASPDLPCPSGPHRSVRFQEVIFLLSWPPYSWRTHGVSTLPSFLTNKAAYGEIPSPQPLMLMRSLECLTL